MAAQQTESRERVIRISRDVSRRLFASALEADLESGGVLIGWREGDDIVVSRALVVPDRTAGRTTYRRRRRLAERIVRFIQPMSRIEGYVGDWHTHPSGVGASPTDLATFRDRRRRIDDDLAMIVAARNSAATLLFGYQGRPNQVVAVQVVVSGDDESFDRDTSTT